MATTPYETGTWSLTELLAAPSGAPLDQTLAELEAAIQQLEGQRDSLTAEITAADFNAVLDNIRVMLRHIYALNAYGYLWFSEQTQNQDALAFMGRIEQISTAAQNRTLFFDLWFKQLDDATAQRLIEAAGDSAYFLELKLLTKAFVLPEAQEQLINTKDSNGQKALNNIYEMITNAYTYTVTVDGEAQTLTRGALMNLVRRPDADIRHAAYEELYKVYGEQGLVLAQIYIHMVRDFHEENVKLRGFPTPISVRNKAQDIPDAAVDALLETCRANTGVFQRWFALKADAVGMEKLRRCDIYAPLAAAEKEYTYDEGVNLVLDVMNDFSPEVRDITARVFTDDHIHSAVLPGKMGGAFCYGVLPDVTPYVMMNYNNSANDVATLAHELGHAIHDMYAGEANDILTFQPCLPLAETASTFAEMLVTDRLLSEEKDPSVRRSLIGNFLDDNYATIMRQAYFAIWEKTAHQMIKDGASVSELNAAYLENLKEQFGDAVEIEEHFQWEWVSIPHFYNWPFYVYAYAFGQLFVLSLYQRYRAEGAAFVPSYLKILKYGGGASPTHILTEAGVDMTDPAFWQGGFDFISTFIDELETLA